MNPYALLSALCLLPSMALADITLKPGQKPKETAKDIKKAIEERNKDGYTTPECIAKTGKYVTGQAVVIELEAATASLAPVQFYIRQQPKHGVLSAIRPHPDPKKGNLGLVTYLHTGDTTALVDSFTYAAKISEGPTSAPSVVSLTGKVAVAQIEVLKHPLFKPLQAGMEDLGEFVVKNTGTAPLNADMQWPAPFLGPPKIVLMVGEEQSYLIKAKPTAPGSYRLDMPLQAGNLRSTLRSVLECVQPFTILPNAVELVFDKATGQRRATIKVANVSAQPLKLRLDANQRVAVPAELEVPANTTLDFTIALKPEDVDAFRGEVWFLRDPSKEKLSVVAPAEPAQLVMLDSKQSQLDFGTIDRGKDATLLLKLKNLGGVVASIAPLNAPPFFIATPVDELNVGPGHEKDLIIAFKPDLPGKYDRSITLNSTGGDLLLKAQAVMVDPKRPSTMSNGKAVNPATTIQNPHTPARSSPPPRMSLAPAAPASVVPAPAPTPLAHVVASAPQQSSADSGRSAGQLAAIGYMQQFGMGLESLPVFRSKVVDPMQALRAFEIGSDEIVLGWLLPEQNQPKNVRIELANLVYNPHLKTALKSWVEVKEWTTAAAPSGAGAARISGLSPDRQYEFRVLGVDSEGKLSKASDQLIVQTLEAPLVSKSWLMTGLILALVGYAAWSFLKQRKQLSPSRERLSPARA